MTTIQHNGQTLTLHNTIPLHRKKKGWNVQQLAELIGVNPATVYRWENGERIPDWQTMQVLAQVLSAPVDSLFSRDEIGWARVNERGRK